MQPTNKLLVVTCKPLDEICGPHTTDLRVFTKCTDPDKLMDLFDSLARRAHAPGGVDRLVWFAVAAAVGRMATLADSPPPEGVSRDVGLSGVTYVTDVLQSMRLVVYF